MGTNDGVKSSIKLKNVDHIALNVIDIDETHRFYRDVLGFKADREIPPKGKRRHIEMEAGNICLALFECPDLDMKSAHEIMTHQGYQHLAFEVEVDEFDSVVESLKEHKVNLDGKPRNHGGGPSVYFFDPNGYQIELHANT
jgi:catechol 2,3-dioxygenase-like lactoylglutathione lyase family enzyme